jgi:hypothetical protein
MDRVPGRRQRDGRGDHHSVTDVNLHIVDEGEIDVPVKVADMDVASESGVER